MGFIWFKLSFYLTLFFPTSPFVFFSTSLFFVSFSASIPPSFFFFFPLINSYLQCYLFPHDAFLSVLLNFPSSIPLLSLPVASIFSPLIKLFSHYSLNYIFFFQGFVFIFIFSSFPVPHFPFFLPSVYLSPHCLPLFYNQFLTSCSCLSATSVPHLLILFSSSPPFGLVKDGCGVATQRHDQSMLSTTSRRHYHSLHPLTFTALTFPILAYSAYTLPSQTPLPPYFIGLLYKSLPSTSLWSFPLNFLFCSAHIPRSFPSFFRFATSSIPFPDYLPPQFLTCSIYPIFPTLPGISFPLLVSLSDTVLTFSPLIPSIYAFLSTSLVPFLSLSLSFQATHRYFLPTSSTL